VNPANANADREFGDYDFLTSVGDTIYGTFAGLRDVNVGVINTTELIDPFFFSATEVVEPVSWSLLLTGLAGAAWFRRRRAQHDISRSLFPSHRPEPRTGQNSGIRGFKPK
jgi:hypothetical protein